MVQSMRQAGSDPQLAVRPHRPHHWPSHCSQPAPDTRPPSPRPPAVHYLSASAWAAWAARVRGSHHHHHQARPGQAWPAVSSAAPCSQARHAGLAAAGAAPSRWKGRWACMAGCQRAERSRRTFTQGRRVWWFGGLGVGGWVWDACDDEAAREAEDDDRQALQWILPHAHDHACTC